MMRMPAERQTCWELLNTVLRRIERLDDLVEEHSFGHREALLNLLGAIETAEQEIKEATVKETPV